MIKKEDIFPIGKLTKPHGIKGEMLFVGDIDIVNELPKPFIICEINGLYIPFFIESIRPRGNASLLIKLEDVNNENETTELTNQEVFYLSNLMENVPYSSFNIPDITGFTVENEEGVYQGKVVAIDDSTENILMLVEKEHKEWMMPLADELIKDLDLHQKKITVNIPDGLLDL